MNSNLFRGRPHADRLFLVVAFASLHSIFTFHYFSIQLNTLHITTPAQRWLVPG